MFVPSPIVRKYHTFKFVCAIRIELLLALVGVDCYSNRLKGDRVTQCTAHERGVANAVKVGQNNFF